MVRILYLKEIFIMKNAKKILCLLLAISMVFSFVACSKDKENVPSSSDNTNVKDKTNEDSKEDVKTVYPFKFTDDSGKELILEKVPEKIASGAPSITETVYAIGAQDKLVGVTEYCNYPEEAKQKEIIGGYTGPNVEKIIELGVDLYITDTIADDVKKTLNDAGVMVAVITAKNYNDIFAKIALIGEVLDKKQDSENLLESMKNRQEAALNAISGLKGKKVFHEVWHDPLMTSGPGTFIDEMIKMCGGENIAGDAESPYPEFSVEKLIERNPEVYLTADDGFKTVDDIKARTGYDQIDAIKNDRIYFLDADVISRPGPRIVEALELIAEAMYPEVFEGK